MKKIISFHTGSTFHNLKVPLINLLECVSDKEKEMHLRKKYEHYSVLQYIRLEGFGLLQSIKNEEDWAQELSKHFEKHSINHDHIMMILMYEWEYVHEMPRALKIETSKTR